MRLFLVCNPGSRGRRGGRLAEAYRGMLSSRGTDFDWAATRDLDDAGRLANQAFADGFDAVVAIGGDGTINRVANGLLNGSGSGATAGGSAGAAPRMGVLYAGTSPDFCRFHGLPVRPEAAVDALLSGQSRAVDAGRIRFRGADGTERSSAFLCSANLGLGAGVASRANRWRPRLGDFLGTLAATAATVAAARPRRCRLIVDGREEILDRVLNVTVGKNPFLAGGLKLGIDSGPADGLLYFFAICRLSRPGLLLSLPRLYSGSIARDRRFLAGRANAVRVEPLGGEVDAEFDGDPAGLCPAEATVVPRALVLLGAS